MPMGTGSTEALRLRILPKHWLLDFSPHPSNISSARMQNSKNIYRDHIFMLARQRIPLCSRRYRQTVNKSNHPQKKPQQTNPTLLPFWYTTSNRDNSPPPLCSKFAIWKHLKSHTNSNSLLTRASSVTMTVTSSCSFPKIKSQSKFSMQKNTFLDYHLPSVLSSLPPSTAWLMLVL